MAYHNHLQDFQPFPASVDAVTTAAVQTIAAVICGASRLDPTILQNAMIGDRVHGRRPVRQVWDAGRIGIKIDCSYNKNNPE